MPWALFLNGEKENGDFDTKAGGRRHALELNVVVENISDPYSDKEPREPELEPGYEIREIEPTRKRGM